jgi:hypothetical protein
MLGLSYTLVTHTLQVPSATPASSTYTVLQLVSRVFIADPIRHTQLPSPHSPPSSTTDMHVGPSITSRTPTTANITTTAATIASFTSMAATSSRGYLFILFFVSTYFRVKLSTWKLASYAKRPILSSLKVSRCANTYCVLRPAISHINASIISCANPYPSIIILNVFNTQCRCSPQRLLPSATRRSCCTNASR